MPLPARMLVEPPVRSLHELHERIAQLGAGPASEASPFLAGDVVVVPHALWNATLDSERAFAQYVAAVHGVTLRPGYADEVVVERPLRPEPR
jgi:hypothetical protein